MTMLERAARALVLAQSDMDCFDDLEPEAQEAAREHVRAVLRALREPSEEMVEAGVAAFTNVRDIWRAMLDAALSECENGRME